MKALIVGGTGTISSNESYCRLSRDDNLDTESNNISNQRLTLQWYVDEHFSFGLELCSK